MQRGSRQLQANSSSRRKYVRRPDEAPSRAVYRVNVTTALEARANQ